MNEESRNEIKEGERAGYERKESKEIKEDKERRREREQITKKRE